MDTRYSVGVDIGGTKIYAGVVNLETGAVVATARKRTHPERGADFFTERLFTVIQAAIEGAHLDDLAEDQRGTVAGLGAGIAGQVDRAEGVLISGPNLGQGLDNLPIRSLLHERFKLPVKLGNDVEVATLGEQMYGAGRGCNDFVCLFVGTGIGSAIIQNGVLRRGATGTAGEIGHTVLDYDGRLCGCGGRGHLEAYASRTAIARVLLAELERGRASQLREELQGDDVMIRSKMLARCVEAQDELVLEVLTEAADYLGAGLASLAAFYNPARIIVGGGLVDAIDLFFERAARSAALMTLPTAAQGLEIVRAKLGDDSGIAGAAWLTVAEPA